MVSLVGGQNRNMTRLRMSLLDRLIDPSGADRADSLPAHADASALPPSSRPSGSLALRRAIQRDLSWLFNASNNAWTLPLTAYPELATSVVNFGVRSYAGLSGIAALGVQLERSLHAAILAFEPRINPETLRVQVLPDDEPARYRHHIALAIHGELHAQATTEVIYLKTEFDLDSGTVSMTDVSEAQQFIEDHAGSPRTGNASGRSAGLTDLVVQDSRPSVRVSGGRR